MAPASSLEALMSSPTPSSNDSTFHVNGKTLPDVSLGSLGSSFRSEDQEDGNGERVRRTPLAKAPRLQTIQSPETSRSTDIATPSSSSRQHPPASALLLSPPTTVRRASSHGALPNNPPAGSQAPRRPRILRRNSASSTGSSGSEDRIAANIYGSDDDSAGNALNALSINVSQGPLSKGGSRGKGYNAGPSKRSGRHSVAHAGDQSGVGPLSLRDQEKQLKATQAELFSLQLENYFLKEQLSKMAPDHIEAALKENVKLKLEILNLSKEMKTMKKLVTQQDKDLAEAQKERDMASSNKHRGEELRQLEAAYQAEREKRKAAEQKLQDAGDEEGLRADLEDAEASETIWRNKAEELEDQLEEANARISDQAEEIERLTDAKDRAEDELERKNSDLGSSVGVGRGREARTIAKLEQENAELQAELEARERDGGDPEELEERINELRDQLAAARLDVDRRDTEIEQLNEELDIKVRDHDKEVEQVASEWREELLEARAQVDELKDIVEGREQEVKEAREALEVREDELHVVKERVLELEAAQAETRVRLEETLRNIQEDNTIKEADLVAANQEIAALGQTVYDLEEACEELKLRETNLTAELKAADEDFEKLESALKDDRRKWKHEKDALLADFTSSEQRLEKEIAALNRKTAEKDQAIARLQTELDSARDRIVQRDNDLNDVESSLKALQSERRQMGDTQSADKAALELEIERVKRDLRDCEDDLERARDDVKYTQERLRAMDLENARMADKQRDLETKLSSERQGRLNLSDKLDMANKATRQQEKEANTLRDRLSALGPQLEDTRHDRYQIQKESDRQRQDNSELLLWIFKNVNDFLDINDIKMPAEFNAFRDTLKTRFKSIMSVKTHFNTKIKAIDTAHTQSIAALNKQLTQRLRSLDNFESSVSKLEVKRREWKSKYDIKLGELEAAKSRNTELSKQLSSMKAGTMVESTSQIRALSEKSQNADKKVQVFKSQLSRLEAEMAEREAQHGQAEEKWAVRVKEYENQLKAMAEKIKTEKQGGKERAAELLRQIGDITDELERAKKRNTRAERVVAQAHHFMPSDESL